MDELVEVNPPPPLLYRIHPDGRRQCIEDYRDTDGTPDPLEGRPLSDAYVVWVQKPDAEPKADQGYLIAAEYCRGDSLVGTPAGKWD